MVVTLTDTISLRTAAPDDRVLLRAIYGSTRQHELDRTDWDDRQKEAFIDHQFDAQDEYYKKVYPDSDYDILLYEGQPAGRLYVERHLIPGTIRIVDIALLPDFRNQGIGQIVLNLLQEEAAQTSKSLSIHVERFNPAMRLYERLGFQKIKETHGVYYLMEWKAPALLETDIL